MHVIESILISIVGLAIIFGIVHSYCRDVNPERRKALD